MFTVLLSSFYILKPSSWALWGLWMRWECMYTDSSSLSCWLRHTSILHVHWGYPVTLRMNISNLIFQKLCPGDEVNFSCLVSQTAVYIGQVVSCLYCFAAGNVSELTFHILCFLFCLSGSLLGIIWNPSHWRYRNFDFTMMCVLNCMLPNTVMNLVLLESLNFSPSWSLFQDSLTYSLFLQLVRLIFIDANWVNCTDCNLTCSQIQANCTPDDFMVCNNVLNWFMLWK